MVTSFTAAATATAATGEATADRQKDILPTGDNAQL